jgi:hypothetical protein
MWQIRTGSGSLEEVLWERLDCIRFQWRYRLWALPIG